MSLPLGLVAPQSVTLYWYVVRASGFVVYLLLTIGVLSGLLLTLRWRSDAWPRLLTEGVHQFLQLLGLAFLAVHVISTLLDTFISFAWFEVLIPFTGPYRVPWMGLGIVAMYLMIALAISIYVRRMIGYRTWRLLHYAGFGAWILALAHGITTGTDTRSGWAMAVYGISIVLVAGLVLARFGGIPLPIGHPPQQRLSVLVAIGLLLLTGTALAFGGPLRSSWSAQAGSIPGPRTRAADTLPSFRETISGLSHPFGEYVLNPGYKMLTLDLDGGGSYPVTLEYRMLVHQTPTGIRFIRGLYSMRPTSRVWTCTGTVVIHPPDQLVSMCRPNAKTTARVFARVHIDARGRVSGSIRVGPSVTARAGA
ncbi:MAG: hypothetical protein NVSMB52_14460 [Chloroflexota bacterium]